jgi:hypothetical protein
MTLVFSLAVSLGLPVPADVTYASEQAHHRCRQHPFGEFSEWSEPVNLGDTVNSPFDDYHPAISNNGLSLYLTSNRPGGFSSNEDIWVSQRPSIDDSWGQPRHLGANINSEGGTCCPNLSPDEHWLYFAGDRPGGCGFGAPYNLWVSHREDTNDDFAWEPAVNLGCQLHAPPPSGGECAPTYFEDEETGITSLYFCRGIHDDDTDYDIYVSMLRRDGLFGRPSLVWELTTRPPSRNTRTAIRRDGLEMLITSNRPGGQGANDIWVSTRETTLDAWSTPENLPPPINTPAAEGGPALSCDSTAMYFFSSRPGGFGGRDLYVSTRTELCDQNGAAVQGHGCEKK